MAKNVISILQWAGHAIRMEEHRITNEAPQQTIHSNRRVGKPVQDGKME
jgi:hypothetical protein